MGAGNLSTTIDDSQMLESVPEVVSEQEGAAAAPADATTTEPIQQGMAGAQSEPEKEQTENEEVSLEIDEQAQTVLAAAGLDLGQFTQEYSESGGLSEESYAKLENEAGIPRQIVEQYIAGQQLLAEQTVETMQNTAFSLTGGQDQYQNLVQWAGQNLSAEEVTEYNEAVGSVNKSKVENAIRSLIHRRESSEGFEGNRVTGSTVQTSSGGDIFQDTHQLQEAIANPLYRTSSAYRSQIEAKMARSKQHHPGGRIPA